MAAEIQCPASEN